MKNITKLVLFIKLIVRGGNDMYDYLVVGAGLYGVVFAHEALKKGKRVLVIDQRTNIA